MSKRSYTPTKDDISKKASNEKKAKITKDDQSEDEDDDDQTHQKSIESILADGTNSKLTFEEVAEELLLRHEVVAGGSTVFRLAEIEFYLNSDRHNDPFVHLDPHQKTSARWYFHRQNGGAYKSGTYKGLDISFGGKMDDGSMATGGILIRSVISKDGSKIVEGSCNCANYILKCAGKEGVKDLVDTFETVPGRIGDTSSLLYMRESSTPLTKNKIHQGPRVGLTLKRAKNANDSYCQYIMKPYRFTSLPPARHKKALCTLALEGMDLGCTRFGVSAGKMGNWKRWAEEGAEMEKEDFLKAPLSSLKTVESLCKGFGAFSESFGSSEKKEDDDDDEDEASSPGKKKKASPRSGGGGEQSIKNFFKRGKGS